MIVAKKRATSLLGVSLIIVGGLVPLFKQNIVNFVFGGGTDDVEVGAVAQVKGSVLVKSGKLTTFETVEGKKSVSNGSRVWTTDSASAELQLENGNVIELAPGTLIEVQIDDSSGWGAKKYGVNVVQGSIQAKTLVVPMTVNHSGGTIVLSAPTTEPIETKSPPTEATITRIEAKPVKPQYFEIGVGDADKNQRFSMKKAVIIRAVGPEGSLRLQVKNDRSGVVYLGTKLVESSKNEYVFVLDGLDPGAYSFDVDWFGLAFESIDSKKGVFEVSDYRPPLVQVQSEIPVLSENQGSLGWSVGFATDSANTVTAKLYCREKTYLPELIKSSDQSFFIKIPDLDFLSCDSATYQMVATNKQGVEKSTERRRIDSSLPVPAIVSGKDGIGFGAPVKYESFLIELSADKDFDRVQFRSQISAQDPFVFDRKSKDRLYIRVKGQIRGLSSSFSSAQALGDW